MSINLVAVTALGGIPLFTRNICMNKLNEASIPFATLAALNGVNLFSRLNNANLMSTETRDTRISWKVFKGSIVLIVISTTDSKTNFSLSDNALNSLLNLIFDVLVLSCGLNEVIGHNIEKLKRCLKSAYQPLDHVLKLLCSGKSLSIITNRVEYSFIDNHFHSFVESFLESCCHMASTNFACIMVSKKIIAATKHWWQKLCQSSDSLLVTIVVNSFPQSDLVNGVDVSIYLPSNCPNAVTRVIASQISKNVVLVLLCGEHPSKDKVDKDIVTPLKQSKQHQENFIAMQKESKYHVRLDENLIGLLMLRSDYNVAVKLGKFDQEKLRDVVKLMDAIGTKRRNTSSLLELHAVYQSYKCFVVYNETRSLFCTFALDLPLTKIRAVTLKTFSYLSKEKKLWP